MSKTAAIGVDIDPELYDVKQFVHSAQDKTAWQNGVVNPNCLKLYVVQKGNNQTTGSFVTPKHPALLDDEFQQCLPNMMYKNVLQQKRNDVTKSTPNDGWSNLIGGVRDYWLLCMNKHGGDWRAAFAKAPLEFNW